MRGCGAGLDYPDLKSNCRWRRSPAEAAVRSPGPTGQQPERPLTLMLVDPEMSAQRGLVTSLGSKGHRVVPSTAEGAGDIVQRLHFDAVLWAVRPGRSGWSEFHDRYRASIPAFVLIADSYDPQLAQSLGPRGGFLLSRPVQDKKLAEILREICRPGAADLEPGRRDPKVLMRFRRMPDSRRPAFRGHSPVRFFPVGKVGGVLSPMDDGCLVAPFRELAHRAAVRHRHHERAHGGFILPGSLGPVSVSGIPQQFHAKIAGSAPGLIAGTQRVGDESRQEPKGPDS